MSQYTGLKGLAGDEHSSLMGPFVSYEENEVLCIRLALDVYGMASCSEYNDCLSFSIKPEKKIMSEERKKN